ncbi:MAG: diguanylate cyclase [Pseudomonadota bacterium]|nr:diguanylate cyclase [Pseudomonadota bacterium]
MQGSARVLIVGRDSSHADGFARALNAEGIEASTGNISESAAELCGDRRPDVVILNMGSGQARSNPKPFLALARTIKKSAFAARMRILLIGGNSIAETIAAAGHVDDILIGEANPVQIRNRVRALVRLNTMHEELVRRIGTNAKYGLDAPAPATPPESTDGATVLVLGDPGEFARIENALASRSTLVGALSPSTALDYLARRPFDAVVVNAGAPFGTSLDFVRDMRRNSRLYNTPVILLAAPETLEDAEDIYASGVTDAIAKPFTAEELRLRVNALVRESRFRDALKTIYAEARHFATSDALTGLYTRGFLLEHMNALIADANRTSQGFALAGLTITNLDEINHAIGYAAGDRIIRQIGEVVGLLIRGEDLAARYSGRRFAILLPDTTEEGARHAIERIKGVVTHTEFVVEDHNAPVHVRVATGLSAYHRDDTPEKVVARSWSTGYRAAA